MEMVELNDLLPESQWESNWTFYGSEHEGFSTDSQYVVFECYCKNPSCHCKRLMATVMQLDENGRSLNKTLAIINYDWSSKETECEPTLDEKSPKTELAGYILEVYKKFIHHPDYVTRIKDQYRRVKQLAAEKNLKNVGMKKIGRNDLCHCGSNKKYKKCCMIS